MSKTLLVYAEDVNAGLLHDFDDRGLTVPGSSPALCASKDSGHRWLSQASAIWLRALLWMQTKRTLFFIDLDDCDH